MAEITITSQRKIQAIDITEDVLAQLLSGDFAWIAAPHTTAAILLSEADEELLADIERVAGELFAQWEPFRHRKNDNPNAAAHLLSAFAGAQVVRPIHDGRVELGTYQRVLFLELDGPRERRVEIRDLVTLP